jgi:hypothetical protein
MFAANMQPNSVWKNQNFHHNNFTTSSYTSWGGIFLIGKLGVQNYSITNNIMKIGAWPDNKFVVFMGTQGGVTQSGNTITH